MAFTSQSSAPAWLARLRGPFSDALLWVLIVTLVGGGIYYWGWGRAARFQQEVTLSFHDANEMIPGSTVHMMGVDVGYVDRIQMHPDRVDVTFKTLPGIRIPPGSKATIKFTGLVGSKSIEIDPPPDRLVFMSGDDGPPHHWISVEEPIRLKHAIDYNIEIAQALERGAEHFSDFFGKRKPVEELVYNLGRSKLITDGWVAHFSHAANQSRLTAQKYQQTRPQVLQVLVAADGSLGEFATLTGREVFKPSTGVVVTYLDDLFRESATVLQGFSQNHGFWQAQEAVRSLDVKLKEPAQRLQRWGAADRTSRLESALGKADRSLHIVEAELSKDPQRKLTGARQAIQAFSETVVRFTHRL